MCGLNRLDRAWRVVAVQNRGDRQPEFIFQKYMAGRRAVTTGDFGGAGSRATATAALHHADRRRNPLRIQHPSEELHVFTPRQYSNLVSQHLPAGRDQCPTSSVPPVLLISCSCPTPALTARLPWRSPGASRRVRRRKRTA